MENDCVGQLLPKTERLLFSTNKFQQKRLIQTNNILLNTSPLDELYCVASLL